MGTPSLICVFYKGRFVVAQYAHWDGYPEGEGQGLKVLNFLLDPVNILRLKGGLDHIYFPDKEEIWQFSGENDLFWKEHERSWPMGVKDLPWPSISRDTGAGILEIVTRATAEKPVPIELALEFANDCECQWAYVVDLDHGIFEVFAGSVFEDKTFGKRFSNIGEAGCTVPALLKRFSITKLPATKYEFITTLIKAQDEKREITVHSPAPQWITRTSQSSKASKLGEWRSICNVVGIEADPGGDFIGFLNALPPEVRKIIYEYVYSVPLPHAKAKTGFGLLRSSTIVYEEAISVLYQSRLFGIVFRPEDDMFKCGYIEWRSKDYTCNYGEFCFSRDIGYLSSNFFSLVQNLQIYFKLDDEVDSTQSFKLRTESFQKGIFQLCNNLRDNTQLHYLDIRIYFTCDPEDISHMVRVIEPIKMLRGIQNPNITVYGFQKDQEMEPRWDITEEYAQYLEELLTSAHGMPVCSADGIQVFEDLFDLGDEIIAPSELDYLSLDIELEETIILQYLRDVYNTTNRTVLYGDGLSGSDLEYYTEYELSDPL